jgi:hypothetical protein
VEGTAAPCMSTRSLWSSGSAASIHLCSSAGILNDRRRSTTKRRAPLCSCAHARFGIHFLDLEIICFNLMSLQIWREWSYIVAISGSNPKFQSSVPCHIYSIQFPTMILYFWFFFVMPRLRNPYQNPTK